MLVTVERTREGDIVLTPVSRTLREKIVAYLKEYAPRCVVPSENVYLQVGFGRDEFIETLSREHQNDLDQGWSFNIRMDNYEYLQGLVGYDAGDNNLKVS